MLAHAVRAGCQSTRRLGIEWIQLAACDGARLPAGAEIVRLNVGARIVSSMGRHFRHPHWWQR